MTDCRAVDLARRMLDGERSALSRLLTLVEEETPDAMRVLRFVQPYVGRTYTIGITGPPGSGKSTLVDALTRLLRGDGRSVGVVALDPSSPFSGGAILGDRIRMQRHALDPGVFIRSLATRGSSGGLARATRDTVRLLDASGRDVCIVETAGVGQVELDVMDVADTVVVVSMPETGDGIQAMKAGLLEIADVLVVNKADLNGAARLSASLEEMVRANQRHPWWLVPVVTAQADTGVGVDTLLDKIMDHRRALEQSSELLARRKRRRAEEFIGTVERTLGDRLRARIGRDPRVAALYAQVMDAEIDPHAAAVEVFDDGTLVRRWLLDAGDGC